MSPLVTMDNSTLFMLSKGDISATLLDTYCAKMGALDGTSWRMKLMGGEPGEGKGYDVRMDVQGNRCKQYHWSPRTSNGPKPMENTNHDFIYGMNMPRHKKKKKGDIIYFRKKIWLFSSENCINIT